MERGRPFSQSRAGSFEMSRWKRQPQRIEQTARVRSWFHTPSSVPRRMTLVGANYSLPEPALSSPPPPFAWEKHERLQELVLEEGKIISALTPARTGLAVLARSLWSNKMACRKPRWRPPQRIQADMIASHETLKR